jgi:hypothetical protein
LLFERFYGRAAIIRESNRWKEEEIVFLFLDSNEFTHDKRNSEAIECFGFNSFTGFAGPSPYRASHKNKGEGISERIEL